MSGKSDPDYIDYIMSEKFGLDWKQYDGIRMEKFIRIVQWESEKERKQAEKNNSSKSKFRPRM